MLILLVEDNQYISENIKKFMKLENINIEIANNWKIWREKFNDKHYDFALIDIMLPEIDGLTLCKKIREISEIPIILLTAKSQLDDKLLWFESWADDYLTKPFDLEELLARIKTIKKRFEEPEKFIYKNLEVFLDSQKIFKNWKEVKITLKEFQIFKYLIDHQGIAVSRTDILEHIRWWDELFSKDDKLDVYISNIRKKSYKELIETIKWFWYQINK